MATGGLYGSTATAVPVVSDTDGLYGSGSFYGGTFFEWFIFQQSATAPATPTGGTWSFQTSSGTPPSGWSNAPPASPTEPVWVSIAFINSITTAYTWSTPALFYEQGATGATGPAGPTGPTGPTGATGAGVPTGGTVGQFLYKNSSTNYDTSWNTLTFSEISGTATNAQLVNSSVTINGNSVSLGGSTTVTAVSPYTLTIGTGLSGGSYNGSSAVTVALSNSGVTSGTYGTSTAIPSLTVNAQGQITSITTSPLNSPAYQGTWNASTNSPTLTSSSGTNNNYYVVSVAGTTTLNGISLWSVGDWVIFSSSANAWEKINGSSAEAFSALTVTGLTGYMYANGTSQVTASTTIPTTALSGTITNAQLANSSITVGTTGISLGSSSTTLAGLTSVTSTGFTGALTGNASSATNLNAGSTYAVPYQVSSGNTSYLSAGTSGNLLMTLGTVAAPIWMAPSSLTVGSATTATNLAGGVNGSLPYQTASGTTTFLAPGTNGYVLTLAGGVPTWSSATGASITITDDTTTNATRYPLFANQTSGTASTEYTSSTKLQYNPSTGLFTAPTFVATEAITGSLSAGAFSYGTLGYSDVNIFASFASSVNTYNQVVLQNTNTGSAASTDYVVSNNNGTASTYYGDFGMNSSGWTGTASTNSFNAPNMVYLTSTSGDLLIGTTTSNTIRFATNGGADAIQVTTAGNVNVVNSLNTPNTFGFKNRLINGGMGIWQRGTSGFTTSGNYCADRWFVTASTSLSTVAQSTDVPSGFKYSLSISGTNYPNCVQRIESTNCTDLASQNVTISFWAKQTSGAGSNSLYLQLYYAGSSDVWSSPTQIGSNILFTGTSSWAQYTATFTSISSNAVNGLEVLIGAYTSGSATFEITGIQLEKGTQATSFDYRPYGTELALCQRYLPCWNWQSGNDNIGIGYSVSTTQTIINVSIPVTPRVIPTGISVSGISNIVIRNGSNVGGTPTSIVNNVLSSGTNQSLFVTSTAASPTLILGQGAFLFASGSAQIQFTGCEL